MTDPTAPPPKPPQDPASAPSPTTAGTPAAPRRIPRAEAPPPAADDPRKVGQRVMEQRPHERRPTEHAATRGNKPDLRDLPRPRQSRAEASGRPLGDGEPGGTEQSRLPRDHAAHRLAELL